MDCSLFAWRGTLRVLIVLVMAAVAQAQVHTFRPIEQLPDNGNLTRRVAYCGQLNKNTANKSLGPICWFLRATLPPSYGL